MMSHSHALLPLRRGGSGDGETPFLRMRSHSHAFSPAGVGDGETPFRLFPPGSAPSAPGWQGEGGANCPWFGSGCSPSLNCDIITAPLYP